MVVLVACVYSCVYGSRGVLLPAGDARLEHYRARRGREGGGGEGGAVLVLLAFVVVFVFPQPNYKRAWQPLGLVLAVAEGFMTVDYHRKR